MSVWFAKYISLPVMNTLGAAFAGASVSVGEITMLASVMYIALRLLLAPFSGKRLLNLKSALLSAGKILAAYALIYLLIWLPVASAPRLGETSASYDSGAVYALCRELTQDAREQYPYYDGNAHNVTAKVAEAIYKLTGRRSAAKISIWPAWMRAFNLAGVCLPWSGEALIRGDMPQIALPFVAAHESAHLMGYGPEYEANYIAYKALSLDEGLSYGGTMYALYYSMEKLKASSPSDYNAVIADMDEKMFGDYATLVSFSRCAALSQGGAADVFLRLSGQEGSGSYGRVTELLLREYTISPAYEEYSQ